MQTDYKNKKVDLDKVETELYDVFLNEVIPIDKPIGDHEIPKIEKEIKKEKRKKVNRGYSASKGKY